MNRRKKLPHKYFKIAVSSSLAETAPTTISPSKNLFPTTFPMITFTPSYIVVGVKVVGAVSAFLHVNAVF